MDGLTRTLFALQGWKLILPDADGLISLRAGYFLFDIFLIV